MRPLYVLLFLLLTLFLFAPVARAGPAVRPPAEPKRECDAARCRARAAFEFERAAAESVTARTAPRPREKAAPKCACAEPCECPAGTCPACPAAEVRAPAPAAPKVAPKAAPAQPTVYREVWRADGRGRLVRELVPVAGDGPALRCESGTCAGPGR